MTEREIRRFADADVLARAAAEYFIHTGQQAIKAGGRFKVALSGGSTPKAVHRLLAADFAHQLAWEHVHVFWGDERSVPPDHENSNYHMAKETLLDHVPIPPSNIYRMQGELAPEQAALAYEQGLAGFFGVQPGVGWPQFDLVFLGMGEDGHTASLFPGTAALQEAQKWVVANHVPRLDSWRITLTVPVINAAHNVVFLVAGQQKADPLREVVNGPYLPQQFPAQLIEPKSGRLVWMLDEAAASLI